MVTILPRDGLGNQMFWFALGRVIAAEDASPLHINTDWFAQNDRLDRPFLLDRFALAGASDVTIGRGGGGWIEHPKYAYPALFEPVAAQLRRDFGCDARAEATHEVGVHVRRGDYRFVSPDGALLMTPERLRAAMARFPGRRFRMFSDDPKWCERHLGGPDVDVMPVGDPVEDLCRLSACADLILANSTFSWWAAWLNERPDKTVLYPRNWHNGAWPGRPDPNGQARLIASGWISY
jgi:hypothetical protein